MKRKNNRTIFRSRRSGFTLIEVMIASAIASLVMIAVASVMLISGRAVKEMYGQTRTRSSRMRGLDQIRYRLIDARASSIATSQPVSGTTRYHRIDFKEPSLGGVTSAFYFNSASKTLYYDSNTADGNAGVPVVVGPIDISFEAESAGAIVKLRIKSSADMTYGDVDLEDGETATYTRNA